MGKQRSRDGHEVWENYAWDPRAIEEKSDQVW
jgi:hypothetical protein